MFQAHPSLNMSALEPQSTHQHERFPGFRVRPAWCYDFSRLARMANEVFQHERDIDYLNKHHRVKMAPEPEATAIDKLLAAEKNWRHTDMLRNRKTPGRHFIVATYLKQPADFLTVRHGSKAKEVILGWAEWQEPSYTATAAALDDGFSDSSDQSEHGKATASSAVNQLESVLESLTLVHRKQPLLVVPNGLAVRLPRALESFRRAATNHRADWARWSEEIIPSCLGQKGDTRSRDLVLRSLVVNPIHWDSDIGGRLLRPVMERADTQGYGIQTLASATNVSTLGAFRAAGFTEHGRLRIFRDTQVLMRWERGGPPAPRRWAPETASSSSSDPGRGCARASQKRALETSDSDDDGAPPAYRKRRIDGMALGAGLACNVEGDEKKRAAELWGCSGVVVV